MIKACQDVKKVGDLPIDKNLINDFINYITGLELKKTHVYTGEDKESNPYYNKYIMHDSIFVRFFQNKGDYEYFLEEVIHTFLLPPCENKKDEHVIKNLMGVIHSFFTEYYKKFFAIRVSISFTDPGSFMHYHRDLAAENADRFLVDISGPENKMSGIEVAGRLYKLERFGVYKLDTTREHRGVNYSTEHKKISLVIQCISELEQYLEYQRKHLEVFFQTRDSDPAFQGLMNEPIFLQFASHQHYDF